MSKNKACLDLLLKVAFQGIALVVAGEMCDEHLLVMDDFFPAQETRVPFDLELSKRHLVVWNGRLVLEVQVAAHRVPGRCFVVTQLATVLVGARPSLEGHLV